MWSDPESIETPIFAEILKLAQYDSWHKKEPPFITYSIWLGFAGLYDLLAHREHKKDYVFVLPQNICWFI